mgnify:CR=1 FL=1
MVDENQITPNPQSLSEALDLSSEILKNLELSELPLKTIALKASRLARLLNDFDYQKIMSYEAGGYPNQKTIAPETARLAILAQRVYEQIYPSDGEVKEYIYFSSVGELEQNLNTTETSLAAARDPDISVSSANPHQYVSAGIVNRQERHNIRVTAITIARRLENRRNFIYQYVLRKHYELKFSGIANDLFSRYRLEVDSKIGKKLPKSINKFSAVYENLVSENPENWANAVHSCRRILQDLADAVFPPTSETRLRKSGNQDIEIKLGNNEYINRLIAFIEDNSDSERFEELIGSHLSYLGDRLDSVFKASQKGSHSTVTKEEADRYVLYTYLLVGDVLSLISEDD